MKKVLELLGFLAVLQGTAGLLHEFTDWRIGLVRRIGFLDGYGIYVNVALLVLGFALCAAADGGRGTR
ncbi:hypothetical protein [Streptomyces sp. NPDC090994]|uniref:hypothetical protein n=1 Tax=Streptomyces sp. NPDC090994 TaxID=3365969 RepID=UPI00382F6470